jgi:hypothetical protein
MSDKFFDRLRAEAAPLRYEPRDDAMWTRLQARIRERIDTAPPDIAQLIAGWFRPLTASLAALTLATALGVAYYEQSHDAGASIDSLAQSSIEVSIGGDTYSVAE